MKNVKNILIGALCILLVLMAIPALHIGHITLKSDGRAVSLTLMHIPVITAALFTNVYGALITGFVFGTATFVNALSGSSGMMNQFLKNPLCSVLPCMIFSFCSYYIFSVLNKKIPYKPVSGIAAAFSASILHSILVTGSMYIFMYRQTAEAMHGLNWLELMKILFPQIIKESLAAVLVASSAYLFIFIYDIKFKKLEIR